MLLGEHTVLHGSAAYAVPLRQFAALISDQPIKNSEPVRLDFSAWAAYAKTCPTAFQHLRVNAWIQDASTLSVQSDIPIGYGLGSSGALTAALWRRYAMPSASDLPLSTLRAGLAELEGFFHGTSSGLDPLVALHDQGIVLKADGSATLVKREALFPSYHPEGRWFLLDSGRPRAGREAIARFRESCQNAHWRATVLLPLCDLVDALTQAIEETHLSATDLSRLSAKLNTLSQLQLRYLDFLIPDDIGLTWQLLLDRNEAWMKLCGAGGGGYFLGYAPTGRLSVELPVRWLE